MPVWRGGYDHPYFVSRNLEVILIRYGGGEDILVYARMSQGNLVWFHCSQILDLHHTH